MQERVATIDVGSNSCVLLISEWREGRLVRLASRIAFTRLAQDLDVSGCLSPASIMRSSEALRGFVELAREFGVKRLSGVGTAALREAKNGADLITRVAEFGLPLRTISGAEEARLSFCSAIEGRGESAALVVDVGGASSEFAWGRNGRLEGRVSLPIGSVRLHQGLQLDAPWQVGDRARVDAFIADVFEQLPEALRQLEPMPLLAVAGTAVSAAQCLLGLKGYDAEIIDGSEIKAESLDSLIADLARQDAPTRCREFGLPSGRADVLPAGLAIFRSVLALRGESRLIVRDRGVAWGEALSLFQGELEGLT
jgi:exopolyphosphatase/guanosine-5'-triphosphate,3'-diphosphate pyrophosphatase